MNPYHFEVTCMVCGEPGAATGRAMAAAWTEGGHVSHEDPRVCQRNLERKREREQRQEQNRQLVCGGEGI